MAPTSCFSGQVNRLPDAPEAYEAVITLAKAAPGQSPLHRPLSVPFASVPDNAASGPLTKSREKCSVRPHATVPGLTARGSPAKHTVQGDAPSPQTRARVLGLALLFTST